MTRPLAQSFPPTPTSSQCYAARGARNYHSGKSAEDIVARYYQGHGYELAHHRWTSAAGELDLIFRKSDRIVVVEVKSSRSFDRAIALYSRRQAARIYAATEIFLASEPLGLLTDMRVDLALVDGAGDVQVIENAFWDD